MYGEVLTTDASSADEYCFVTTNTKDFSLPDGDTRQPHPDIAEFFNNPRSDRARDFLSKILTH